MKFDCFENLRSGIGIALIALTASSGCLERKSTPSPSAEPASEQSQPFPKLIQKTASLPAGITTDDVSIYNQVYGRETAEDYAKRYASTILSDRLFGHRHPINFWGRVIDQNGKPIAGIIVTPVWNDFVHGKAMHPRLKTDENGLFRLIGGTGESLHFSMERTDQLFPVRGMGTNILNYSTPGPERYIPNPLKPENLIVWKPSVPVEVMKRATYLYLPCDEKWVGFDLLSTVFSTNGPLFVRTGFLDLENTTNSGMRIEVFIRGGGVINTADEFAWHPPETGWTSSASDFMSRSLMRHPLGQRRNFYCFIGEHRLYGALSFEPESASVSVNQLRQVRFLYHVNTNGMRRVEHDPYEQWFASLPSSTGGWEKGLITGDPPGYQPRDGNQSPELNR